MAPDLSHLSAWQCDAMARFLLLYLVFLRAGSRTLITRLHVRLLNTYMHQVQCITSYPLGTSCVNFVHACTQRHKLLSAIAINQHHLIAGDVGKHGFGHPSRNLYRRGIPYRTLHQLMHESSSRCVVYWYFLSPLSLPYLNPDDPVFGYNYRSTLSCSLRPFPRPIASLKSSQC